MSILLPCPLKRKYIYIYIFSCTRFFIFLRHMGSLVVTFELLVAAYGIYFLSRDRIWAPCFGSTVVLATGLPGKSHPCPVFNGLFVPAIILYMLSAHIDGPSHPLASVPWLLSTCDLAFTWPQLSAAWSHLRLYYYQWQAPHLGLLFPGPAWDPSCRHPLPI